MAMPNGGWVLRRVEKCESVKGVAEKVESSSHSGEPATDTGLPAQHATELVTWVPVKRPLERVVDHYRILVHKRDATEPGDEFLGRDSAEASLCEWVPVTEYGITSDHVRPLTRRPVYATPEFKTLADVPEGRVISVCAAMMFRHRDRWHNWEKTNGTISILPGVPTVAKFVVTDYVMERKAV